MHHIRTMMAGRARRAGRAAWLLRAAFALGTVASLCACNTDRKITGAPAVPYDYRLRHPISITEKEHGLKVFVGAFRDSLTPAQRAEVLAFAQSWRDEATGGVIIDVPVGTPNERSSAAALREVQSILAASGVPPASMAIRPYRATPQALAPLRIAYPRMTAQAGPCGLWPADIGPSFNRDYRENQPPWNYGCATQRNLAAMVENPADLVQPRGEAPVYTMRRTTVLEHYRKGDPTGATVQNNGATAGRISTIGQ
jgi:pilus assembly protein CpaD